MTVMRLVPDVSRGRNGHSAEDLAVVGRIVVEVDDREKVRRDARLVARPDVQRLRLSAVTIVTVGVDVTIGGARRPTLRAGRFELVSLKAGQDARDDRERRDTGDRYQPVRAHDDLHGGSEGTTASFGIASFAGADGHRAQEPV